jgi:hypothetical protein
VAVMKSMWPLLSSSFSNIARLHFEPIACERVSHPVVVAKASKNRSDG